MAKNLITKIEVNLVPSPRGGNTYSPELSLLIFFAINLPSQSFLACHLGFQNFFHPGFFGGCTPFFTAWLFLVRLEVSL